MLTGVAGSVIPRRSYSWLRRRLVLNAGSTRPKEIELRQRHFSKLLVPGGLVTEVAEGRDTADPGLPVESDTIEQFIEE